MLKIMRIIDRFAYGGHEGAEIKTRQQVDGLYTRLHLVDREDLVPSEWLDDEIAEEQDIHPDLQWEEVTIPLFGESVTLEVAKVVSPWLHDETGKEVARHLSIVSKTNDGANDKGYIVIGTMFAGRYEGDPPFLMTHSDSTGAVRLVPWGSADAAIFTHLADQLLPEQN